MESGCVPRLVGEGNTELHVVRYGDVNQVEERITFFEEERLEGESFSITPDTPLNATTRRVGSYFFTGPSSWQHKSSQSAESGACLTASPEVNQAGYGFTFALSGDYQVGWVQHECNVTEEPSTTTMAPTTTTTPTTPTTTIPTTTASDIPTVPTTALPTTVTPPTTEASTESTTESSGYTHALGIVPFFVAILGTIRFQF